MAVNHLVTGSNPVEGAIIKNIVGRMAEWSKATVLKTVVSHDTQGSNPCSSSIFFYLKFSKESWQSGLSRTPAKGVNLHGFRGFKSLTFRHFSFKYGPVAQGLEQLAHNQLVVGSIPTRPTIFLINKRINYFLKKF